MIIWPGQPFPLGATYDGNGTNFSLFSETAEQVELCLFDDDGSETRIVLPEITAFIHHGYVPGMQPGHRYGFRVHGAWAPDQGLRANPAKLLLDPYAKAVEGAVQWDDAAFDYTIEGGPDGEADPTDSVPFMARSVVANPYFDWGDDRPPRIPWHETVVYETLSLIHISEPPRPY